MQSGGGIKAFGTRRSGRIILVVVAIAAATLSFLYLGLFFTIPVFLLVALAIPIYLGWKNPRQLAVAGLAALLIASPLIAVGESVFIRTPAPLAQSVWGAGTPYTGPVLAHAYVSPYTGAEGQNFTWTVDMTPSYLPKNASGIFYLVFVVSNCPTATGPSSSFCPSGYPFYTSNVSFGANGTRTNQTVAFHQVLTGANIWYWQMYAEYYANTSASNATNGNYTYIFLNPGNGFATIEGPVSGDFLSTFALVVLGTYEAVFLYVGVVYFVALLIYWYVKIRERRRNAADAMPSPEAGPAAAAPLAAGRPPSTGGAGVEELSCPNCNAVVYPNETRCWKCGVALPTSGAKPTAPNPPG